MCACVQRNILPTTCVSYAVKLSKATAAQLRWKSSAAKCRGHSKKCEFTSFVFPPPPQACFPLWTCWNLLGAGASPACSAPQRQRHWKITLGSRCSRGVIAAALLSQNQAWCSSDSTSLGLISPQCVLARVGAHHIRWWRREPLSNGFTICLPFGIRPTYISPFSSDFPFLLGIVRSDWKIMVFNRSCLQSLRQSGTGLILLGDSVPVAISPFSWARHCDQVRIHHSGMTQWPLKGQNNRRFDQASAPGLERSLSGCHQSPPKLTRIHIYEMPTNTKGRNGTRSRTAVHRRPRWSPKTACKHDSLALFETSFMHWVRKAGFFPLRAVYTLVDGWRPVSMFGWLRVYPRLVLFSFHTIEWRSALIYQGSIH